MFRCSTAHQCSLVQSGYVMATNYTQAIVRDNRLLIVSDNDIYIYIKCAALNVFYCDTQFPFLSIQVPVHVKKLAQYKVWAYSLGQKLKLENLRRLPVLTIAMFQQLANVSTKL